MMIKKMAGYNCKWVKIRPFNVKYVFFCPFLKTFEGGGYKFGFFIPTILMSE